MSHRSQKDNGDVQLPKLDDLLTEQEKERYAQALGESVITSGAAELPPADQVPDGQIGSVPLLVNPPAFYEPNESEALLSVQAVLGTLPQGSMTGTLKQQIAEVQKAGARAPIHTQDALIIVNGRKVTIPAEVRDVPNTLHTYEPLRAQQLYNYFLSPLSNKEFNRLLQIANRGVGPKPLMFLSEKIYFILRAERWTPLKASAAEQFNKENLDARSDMNQHLNEAFGYENTSVILETADRFDISVHMLIKQIVVHILTQHEGEIHANRTTGTITDWKRPEEASTEWKR